MRSLLMMLVGVLISFPALAQPPSYYTGLDLIEVGDTEAALESLHRAFEIDPTDDDVSLVLGELLYRHNIDQFASFVLDEVHPHQGADGVIQLLERYPDRHTGERFLDRESVSDHPGVLLWQAQRKLEQADVDAARGYLDEVIESSPGSIDRFLRLVWLLGDLGRFDDAGEILVALRRDRPDRSLVHLGQVCFSGLDDIEERHAYNRFRALERDDYPEEFIREERCPREVPPVRELRWFPER